MNPAAKNFSAFRNVLSLDGPGDAFTQLSSDLFDVKVPDMSCTLKSSAVSIIRRQGCVVVSLQLSTQIRNMTCSYKHEVFIHQLGWETTG